MANWCVVMLTACMFVAFCGRVTSLKCYSCGARTEAECTANETLKECGNNNLQCSIVQLQLQNVSLSYIKNCFPPKEACALFNESYITSCSESFCSRDYCNGPTPTTLLPTTSPDNSSSESSTADRPSSCKKPGKDTRAAGILETRASSSLVALVALIKILETLC